VSGKSTASEEFLELVKSSLLAALEGFLLDLFCSHVSSKIDAAIRL
jgi:hypothetical protein